MAQSLLGQCHDNYFGDFYQVSEEKMAILSKTNAKPITVSAQFAVF
jgi:hypothetical protein